LAEVLDSTAGLLGSRMEQEVRLRRYELLAGSISDAILFLARDGTIVDANPAATTIFGIEREVLRNTRLDGLCGTSEARDEISRALREAPRAAFEVQCLRRGEPFAAEVTLLDCTDEEVLLIAIVRDISAQHQREATQSLLREIDRRILQNEPLDSILQFITSNVADMYGFPVVQIGLRGEDGSVELRQWAGSESAFVEQIRVRWDESPAGRGPTGTAIRTGTLQQIDIRRHAEFAVWRDKAVWHGLSRALALPLSANGTSLGAMTIFRREPDQFTAAEIEPLRVLADQVAISLVSAADREQLHLQRVALESAANAVLVTDADGSIGWVNPAFTALTGYTLDEARGRTPNILNSGVQNEAFYDQLWTSIRSGHTWRGEIHNRRKDGTVYLEQQVITPVVQLDGRISHFVAIKEDITERKQQEEQIRYLALHDSLTGVPNRRSFERQLERVAHRVEDGAMAALLMLDIDHFKICNDTLGHGAGDQVLIELGCVLQKCLRPDDFLARLGGDEFCVLCFDLPAEQSIALAGRIRAAVQAHQFRVNGSPIELTVSIGVARIENPGEVGTALTRADAALYASKRDGRNRASAYASSDDDATPASCWITRIRTALKEHDFVLEYQPVIRLATGTITHYEALLRMREIDGRLIQPGEFLPVAERFGLMPQIDRWVFDSVVELLHHVDHVCVFMNLSAASLSDRALLEHFERRIREERIGPGKLAFEITETAAISDLVVAQHWIQTLREWGCLFALDDFGVGFSSLAYLRALPVDFIKIDRSFVRDLDVNPTSRALVDAIQRVATTIGKSVIAEGVETEAHRRVLHELNIEHGQGFLWGRPHGDHFPNQPIRSTHV
ncbi:MAG: EAL domain-containing protein, partial [Thermoanaerobaculia bacterium]